MGARGQYTDSEEKHLETCSLARLVRGV